MNKRKSQSVRLIVMIVLTFSFFVVELVVGYVTGSLALVSDSYHMLSDFIALFVGLACVRISYWSSTKNTYGWVRAEVLGALVNSVFLIALCFTIITDGITRLVEPEEIHDVDLLLYVGIAGLGINVFGLVMFCSDTQGGHHGHSHGGGGHGHSHGGGGGGHRHSHGRGHEDVGGGHGHSYLGQGQTNYGSELGGSEAGNSTHAVESNNSASEVCEVDVHEYSAENDHHHHDHHNHHHEGHHHHHHHHQPPQNSGDTVLEILPEYSASVEITSSASPPPYSVEDTAANRKESGVLKSGSQLNMVGVYLHVLGDALGSVVVIVSALVIKFVAEPWVYRLDPAMSIIMSLIILSTTIPLFKTSAMILLQTVPMHIKVSELQDKLLTKVNEITGLHEFHVWQLAGNRIVASGHIRVDNLSDYSKVALKVKSFFHDEGIHSTTFQPEFNENMGELPQTNRDCFLECGPDKQCFEKTCCSNKLRKKHSSSDAESPHEDNEATENVGATSNNSRRSSHEANEATTTVVEIEDCTTM